MRTRAYYRHHRERSIRRKKSVGRRKGWIYKYDGMYSKGKVHCSCKMCNYEKAYGYDKFRYRKQEYWYKLDKEEFGSDTGGGRNFSIC